MKFRADRSIARRLLHFGVASSASSPFVLRSPARRPFTASLRCDDKRAASSNLLAPPPTIVSRAARKSAPRVARDKVIGSGDLRVANKRNNHFGKSRANAKLCGETFCERQLTPLRVRATQPFEYSCPIFFLCIVCELRVQWRRDAPSAQAHFAPRRCTTCKLRSCLSARH